MAVAHAVDRATDAPVEVAFHLNTEGIEPARNAREAGLAISTCYTGVRDSIVKVIKGKDVNHFYDTFEMRGALQGSDGAWYVSRLVPKVGGEKISGRDLAVSYINQGVTAERLTPQVKVVGHESSGFPFRSGIDTVARKDNFDAESFLGDTYQPVIAQAHMDDAREALAELEQLIPNVPTKGWRTKYVENFFGETSTQIARLRDQLNAASWELGRLRPDEIGVGELDPAFLDRTGSLTRQLDDLSDRTQMIFDAAYRPWDPKRERMDVDELTEHIAKIRADIDGLPAAPPSGTRTEPTSTFAALAERLKTSTSTRRLALSAIRYPTLGRTPEERIRNFGVAVQALEERESTGSLSGMLRLKTWLRAVAADAAELRSQLTPDQSSLDPLLAEVEEISGRNGKPGLVPNKQGQYTGYEDFPDYAEIGEMGSKLELYIMLDDHGRLVDTPSNPTW